MSEGYRTLTEKEKQTLRLIVRRYDAKSMARRLGISVHTVNERLRHARRKLEVSSSREAARMLCDRESSSSDFLAYKQIGDAPVTAGVTQSGAPDDGLKATNRFAWIIGGMLIMSLFLATLALSSAMQVAEPAARGAPATTAEAAESRAGIDSEILQSAQRWLELVDEGRWEESWNATGRTFRELNTSAKWAAVSKEVRPPLGAVRSRVASSQEHLPAPPHGYEMIKFRTNFANRTGATETVTLERESAGWRVVGYWIS